MDGDGVNSTPASFRANAQKLDYLRVRYKRTPCLRQGWEGRAWPFWSGVKLCFSPRRNAGAVDAGTLDSLVSGGLFSDACEEIKPPESRPI